MASIIAQTFYCILVRLSYVRGLTLLSALVALLLFGLGAVQDGRTPGELRPGQAKVLSIRIAGPFTLVEEYDPKFAGPRPVHVLESHLLKVVVRTERVERLDILVALSGTESFGVFSGKADSNGLVRVEVELPEAGSTHDWRIPGPDGLRRPGPVREGTVFMLVPYGVADVSGTGGTTLEAVVAQGDVLWVRVEE
jgi:hypothetical protein